MPQTRFIPLTFENGLLDSVEESLLPEGFSPHLENYIPEPSGGVRARRGWQQGSVAGTSVPATRKVRGIGTLALVGTAATPNRRQSSHSVTSGASLVGTWTQATAAGSLLLAVLSLSGSAVSITSVPANWTLLRRKDSAGNASVAVYYKENAASESGTVTFTKSSATPSEIRLLEYTGIALSGAIDKQTDNLGSSASPDSGTTAATTQAAELWAAWFSTEATATYSAPTNGFSLVGATSGIRLGMTEKLVTATGTANSGVTIAGPQIWAGVIVTFKALVTAQTGGRHLVAHDDGTNFDIWAIDREALGSGTWSSVDANLAVADRTLPVAFASGLGLAIWTHPLFANTRKWTGSGAAGILGGSAPEGRAIAFYKNRFFIGKDSDLHYSALGNAEDWTTAGDAGSEPVGQQDGEPIEDIAPSEDGLLIAKLSSLYFLSGTGPDSFALHHLNPGRGYPGRCLLPTPYGVVIAGKKQVWLWAGGAPQIISDAIEGSYNIGGAYVTTAFADDVAYICDSGTGTTWCYDLRRGRWWIETVKTAAERPATIFAHGDQLVYGPVAGTIASLLQYRDEPGGDRVRDVGQTMDLKAHTREEWGPERRKLTPVSLWLAIRQRGGDASDEPLTITRVYDGVAETEVREVLPLAAGSGVFTKRVDVGDGKYHDRVQFLCEQALGTGDDALLEIERASLEIQVEEHTN